MKRPYGLVTIAIRVAGRVERKNGAELLRFFFREGVSYGSLHGHAFAVLQGRCSHTLSKELDEVGVGGKACLFRYDGDREVCGGEIVARHVQTVIDQLIM